MTTHNNDRLIRLPIEDSKSNYLHGFWRWVELLAADDYVAAAEALYYRADRWTWEPKALRERITTFFGGPDPWSVVVPNDRLVKQINDAAQFAPRNEKGWGWLLAQIPLTTEPEDPKKDDILLMGLACSFFIREHDGSYVMEYEIFHV